MVYGVKNMRLGCLRYYTEEDTDSLVTLLPTEYSFSPLPRILCLENAEDGR